MTRLWRLSGIVLVLSAVTAQAALAHASLTDASPAPGEVVSPPLNDVRLTFDEDITDDSSVVVTTPDFQPVAGLTKTVSGASLWLHSAAGLPPGTYTVAWTAITDDGHTTSGSYQFAVADHPPGLAPWRQGVLFGVAILAVGVTLLVWRRRPSAA